MSGGKGKGKGHMGQPMGPAKGAKGRCSQGSQKGLSTEEAENQEIKKEITKLQQVERKLTELGESEESIET
eukprot:7514787-Heterocapsa_arctica.AAC.1